MTVFLLVQKRNDLSMVIACSSLPVRVSVTVLLTVTPFGRGSLALCVARSALLTVGSLCRLLTCREVSVGLIGLCILSGCYYIGKGLKIPMSEFIERLEREVKKSCAPKTGVIYSGGVDSSLLAVLAARHCSVTAYTVGVEEAPDIPFAKQLKSHFHHEIIKLSDEEVDKELDEILPIIKGTEGSISPVRVGAELPSHFAARAAAEDGFKVVLSGQGPDEMFGGYARYLPVLFGKGYPALEKLLKLDTCDLKGRIINIDRAICKSQGVELRNPFLSDEFVEYGLSIDVKERLWSGAKKPQYPCEAYEGKYAIRKFCEKKAAEEILPKEIVWRPKKAAQYGSGMHKALDRLARKHGFKEKAKKAGKKEYLTMFLESRA